MKHELELRWIALTLRQAAWAPVLVFCTFVSAQGLFDLFVLFPSADIPTHFLGGLAITYFFWRAAANARSIAGHFSSASPSLLVFGCTASAAILWEALEFLSDTLLGTRMQHGAQDTASDIFFGLAGALTYLMLREPAHLKRE